MSQLRSHQVAGDPSLCGAVTTGPDYVCGGQARRWFVWDGELHCKCSGHGESHPGEEITADEAVAFVIHAS